MIVKKTPARIRNKREVSAGGLIWRPSPHGEIEVVLVRPAGKDTWTIPKGHLEEGESSTQAALRECREETGLDVTIDNDLGEISYVYAQRARDNQVIRIFKHVHFYLMKFAGGDP